MSTGHPPESADFCRLPVRGISRPTRVSLDEVLQPQYSCRARTGEGKTFRRGETPPSNARLTGRSAPTPIQLSRAHRGGENVPQRRNSPTEKRSWRNYSRIFDAFMKLGWPGFEEEFDRIVPRDRPDYADVKRDLLCEPIFSIKAHRNMADMVLGNKTVDELFDEMAREQEKPQ